MKDSLGERMKRNYENRSQTYLTRRMPVIIRVDGKAFHTLTRDCKKPFDDFLMSVMYNVGQRLLKEIQGAKMIYVQSDEISILLTDYDKLETDAWFDYKVQKVVSISAAIASVEFSRKFGKEGLFDSRAFNLPKEEVANYFLWRYNDWLRNSLNMFARSFFSQRELHGLNQQAVHDKLHEIDKNWASLTPIQKNGTIILKDSVIYPKDKVTLKQVVKEVLEESEKEDERQADN